MNDILKIKNILSEDAALEVQNYLINKYSEKTMVYGPDVILDDPELINVNKKFKQCIELKYKRKIYLSRELQLQINRRDNTGKNVGWHIDGSQEIINSKLLDHYVCRQDYQLYKVGIYFQKNDRNSPGGIDVKPVVKIPMKYFPKIFHYPLLLLNTSLSMKLFKGVTIENQPGDAILFNSKIPHRASPKLDVNTPESHKIVLYFNASFIAEYVDLHHKFMFKMAIFGDDNDRDHYKRALSSKLDTKFKGISRDLPCFFNDIIIEKTRNLFNTRLTIIPDDYLIRSAPENIKY
jgi:hypothetical protein